MTVEVPIRYVDHIFERVQAGDGQPGDASWSVHDNSPHPGKEASLLFVCPCGCGELSAVNVMDLGAGHTVWQWNGNRQEPTLTPSIQKTSACRWHGFLTAGIFRTA